MKGFFPSLLLCLLLVCLSVGCHAAKSVEPDLFPTHYRINARLSPEQKTLEVQTEIEYACPTDDLSAVKLRLYANAYQEGKALVTADKRSAVYPGGVADYGGCKELEVLAEGKAASYDLGDGTVMTLRLPRKYQKGESIALRIVQTVTLAKCRHRLGYTDGYYTLSDFYPQLCPFRAGKYLVRDYTPYGDPFVRENADFEVDLTLPLGYECAASALEMRREKQGTFNCFSYRMEGARDFAAVCSQKMRLTETTAGNTVIRYYRESDPDPQKTLSAIAGSVQTFCDLFGAFPYPSYTVVLAPFFEAGVEHSGLSVISYTLSAAARNATILHETAHQWWFGKVGNDEYQNAWMDEGLAEYAVAAYYRSTGLNSAYRAKIQEAEDAYAIRLALTGSEGTRFDASLDELGEGYYDRVYCGGLLLFSSLAEKFGANAFHAALRRYADLYQGRIAAPSDLISCLSSALGEDLSSYFTAWLTGVVPVQ